MRYVQMKKYISVILWIALLLSMTACGATTEETQKNMPESVVDENTETTVEDLLPKIDLAGGTYTILINGTSVDYYDIAELTGDVVDDAIYNARLSINARLNCDLQYLEGPGSAEYATRQQLFDYVQGQVMSGDAEFDAMDNSVYMGVYLMNGLLMDMSKMPYLNIDMPWWDKSITESLAVDGKYPFLAGSFSLDKTAGTFCFYFNEDIATELALPDLYQVVYDGDWTIDKVAEYAELAYVDANGDGKQNDDDQLGMVFEGSNYFTGFYEACGVKALKTGENGFVYDFSNARNVDVVEKVGAFINNSVGVYKHGSDDITYQANGALFPDGNVLFTGGWFKCAESYRDLDFSWGILPYPKLYTEDAYTGGVLNIYGLLGIPKCCPDTAGISAILECLSYVYYTDVIPAYYDVSMKVKYSSGSEMAKMLDFITENLVYDTGLALAGALENTCDITFKDTVRSNGNWASKAASLETKMTTLVEKLNSAYENLG